MISAVIITKNEEHNIPRLVDNLSFCSEVIIVDDNSSDRTVSVARKLGCRVFTRSLLNNFAAQRNYGLSKAKYKWVLFVDADEVVTEQLRRELMSLSDTPYQAYFIKRCDIYRGRKLKYGTWTDSYIRVACKGTGKWKRSVHEYWDITGNVGLLEGELWHYSHDSITEFWKDMQYYSTIHARENYEEGKKSSLMKIFIMPIGKFIDSYVINKGYKDGFPGLLYSSMLTVHSFKAWLILYRNYD